jgi:hypothetical protein
VIRDYVIGGLVALVAVGSSPAPATTPARQPQPALVLKESDFGKTVLVRVGQTLMIDLPQWGLSYGPPKVLGPVSGSQSSRGQQTLRAIGSGSQLITAVEIPAPVSCRGECTMPAPRHGSFLVIAIPADQSFDLAVSELDKDKAFLATPGMRIVAAIPFGDLVDTEPAVVRPGLFPDANSLSVLTAGSLGRSTLSSTAFSLDIVVRSPAARYDIVVPDRDAGRTISARTGQTLAFRLENSVGFSAWRAGVVNLVRPLVEPAAAPDTVATAFGYLVKKAGNETISFTDDPGCLGRDPCRELTRTIEFSLEVAS